MTIQEAIKSGKPFKRTCDYPYFFERQKVDQINKIFSIEDVLAQDWEIEEETIMITRTKLETAWDKMREEWISKTSDRQFNSPEYLAKATFAERLQLLAKHLGFK